MLSSCSHTGAQSTRGMEHPVSWSAAESGTSFGSVMCPRYIALIYFIGNSKDATPAFQPPWNSILPGDVDITVNEDEPQLCIPSACSPLCFRPQCVS